ncbi:conserved hypothetical protein [Talaromyces stipitatus ATCC 10500]|uniref:Uncharacterized protein n=1 Tax=Talaromyces stipitatus (strain ATCC 10500 / CBS 375.48 / QM 6759 / NRRL 1006) TaxID=441959 RepID=B8M7G0_TALSN|nr:uncharacterized protein TSTA_036060 [Talaromyces stipitatus ATCC 10500]EED20380.1 conserved hypothetical protein [Talaromyces stipitatus ATCC 10500]
MGWFDGSSSVSGNGWVRKRSPHRSASIYSSRHSRHSAPSIFSLGGGSRNRSTSSFFSTSSSSRKGVRPRSGFIERMARRIKRLLRDIWSYARRHPIKVFFFVIVPLITGGVLQKLLAMVGLRLPAGLAGHRSEFEQISRSGNFGGLGGSGVGSAGLGESVNGLITRCQLDTWKAAPRRTRLIQEGTHNVGPHQSYVGYLVGPAFIVSAESYKQVDIISRLPLIRILPAMGDASPRKPASERRKQQIRPAQRGHRQFDPCIMITIERLADVEDR